MKKKLLFIMLIMTQKILSLDVYQDPNDSLSKKIDSSFKKPDNQTDLLRLKENNEFRIDNDHREQNKPKMLNAIDSNINNDRIGNPDMNKAKNSDSPSMIESFKNWFFKEDDKPVITNEESILQKFQRIEKKREIEKTLQENKEKIETLEKVTKYAQAKIKSVSYEIADKTKKLTQAIKEEENLKLKIKTLRPKEELERALKNIHYKFKKLATNDPQVSKLKAEELSVNQDLKLHEQYENLSSLIKSTSEAIESLHQDQEDHEKNILKLSKQIDELQLSNATTIARS